MSGQPVFVDPSGRRARWVVRACWALGSVVALYLGLVVLSLMAPPGVTRLGLGPLLPEPIAPRLIDGRGHPRRPAELLSSPPAKPQVHVVVTPTAAATPTKGRQTPHPSSTPVPTRTPGRSGRPSPKPSGHPTPHPHPTH